MAVLYIRNSSGEFEGVQSLNGKTAYQAAKEGGYTGTESEFNSKLAQEIPTALPNPQPITINGQSYDGSDAVTVTTAEIDDTLTQNGKAADAKAVGDRLTALNEANAAQDERLSTLKDDLGDVKSNLSELAIIGKTDYGSMRFNPMSITRSGLEIVLEDDNTITINGTSTNGNVAISTDSEIVFDGLTDNPEQYYFSVEKIDGNYVYNDVTFIYPNIYLQIGDEQKSLVNAIGTIGDSIRNVSNKRIVLRFNFGGANAVVNNLKLRVWANKGTEPIEYGRTTQTQIKESVLPNLRRGLNIVTVGKSNCDYTEVQDAIHGITEDNKENPYTIIVYPGVYERISFNKGEDGSPNYPVRYISIIGVNRNDCIIQSRIGTYHEPAAEIRTNGIIKNLSFITKHDMASADEISASAGYGVHLDNGSCNIEFDNCYIESDMNNALGAGTYNNSFYKFENCMFVNKRKVSDTGLYGGTNASYRGAIVVHTGSNASYENQRVWFENCTAITEDSNVNCNLMNISGTENYEFTFVNNMFFDKTYGKKFVNRYDKTVDGETVSYYINPSVYSYGNNNPMADYSDA